MFDIGWTEMAVIALIGLFVVGPKDLPRVLYTLAGYWKKVRGVAREFQGSLDEMIREAELDDIRREVNNATKLDFGLNDDPTGPKRLDAGTPPKPAPPPAGVAANESLSVAPPPTETESSVPEATVTEATATEAGTTAADAGPKDTESKA